MIKFELVKDNVWTKVSWLGADKVPLLFRPEVVDQICLSCSGTNAQIYAEAWLCLNPDCEHFWCDDHLRRGPEPANLTFEPSWLLRRTPMGGGAQRSFTLIPDHVTTIRELRDPKSLALNAPGLEQLAKGQVCRKCRRCICRTAWNGYTCPSTACREFHPCAPGPIGANSHVNDLALAEDLPPRITPRLPLDYGIQGPFARQLHRMDKITVHGGASVTLLTPSRDFNRYNNTNEIWANILDDANLGFLDCERTPLRPDFVDLGVLTSFFHRTYGQAYDYSDKPPARWDENVPRGVKAAGQLLRLYTEEELGDLFTSERAENSVQVTAYMNGMKMPWHTDGDTEIGPVMSTLVLGGDAALKIRLQAKYHNWYNPREGVIRGAHNWESIRRHDLEQRAGIISPELARDRIRELMDNPAERPEIILPLMHGSMFIVHGQEFTKYYEVSCGLSLVVQSKI